MTPAGNEYTCPKKIEYSWQSIEDVLVVMPDPHLVNDCDIVCLKTEILKMQY